MKERVAITRAYNNSVTKQATQIDKEILFKICALLKDHITNKHSNYNTKDLDIGIAMSNFVKYSENYSRTSASIN